MGDERRRLSAHCRKSFLRRLDLGHEMSFEMCLEQLKEAQDMAQLRRRERPAKPPNIRLASALAALLPAIAGGHAGQNEYIAQDFKFPAFGKTVTSDKP